MSVLWALPLSLRGMRALQPLPVAKVLGFVSALQLGVSARAGWWLSSGSVCVCASAAPARALLGSAPALPGLGRGGAAEPGPLSAAPGRDGPRSSGRVPVLGTLRGPAERKQRLWGRGSMAGAVELGNAVTELQ